METSQGQRAQLHDLTAAECWELAALQPVGRLAWAGPHGPTVVPVNFEITGREVQVRTTAYSALAQECDDSLVAFEVDDFDAGTRLGWSVLMRGRAHLGYHDAHSDGEPDVWAAGARTLRVTVEVDEITGRRLR